VTLNNLCSHLLRLLKNTEKLEGLANAYRQQETGKKSTSEIKLIQLNKITRHYDLESGIGECGIYSGMPLQISYSTSAA